MSDIEREEFEQAVADKWSDSYKFTRFGDEDYYDEVLEGMWWGWQASRQALEGEPTAIVNDSGVLEWYPPYNRPPAGTKLYTHPASREALEGEPIGYVVPRMLEAMQAGKYCGISISDEQKAGDIAVYTHPASRQAVSVPEWIKCSERMPTVNDADFDGYVWWARFNHVARTKQRIVVDGLEHLDDAFWMPTNLTLTQPQPPKQEQGHE